MWLGKFILSILWMVTLFFYSFFLYRQRFILMWYVPKKIRMISLGILLSLFLYSGTEILYYTISDNFLISIFLLIFVQTSLVAIPIVGGIKIYGFYFDKTTDLPDDIKNWTRFGPYLIPHPNNGRYLSILWSDTEESEIELGKDSSSLQPQDSSLVAVQKTRGKKIWKLKRMILDLSDYSHGVYYRLTNSQKIFHIPKNLVRRLTKPTSVDDFDSSIEIIALSDPHADLTSIKQEVNTIRKMCPNAEFVVSSGDNISKAVKWSNWGQFFTPFKNFLGSRLFLTCTGNHDADSKKKVKAWKKVLPYQEISENGSNAATLYYSISYGPLRLFFLDLFNGGSKPRIPHPLQMKQLREDLQNSEDKIKILIMHNSIFCTGEFGCDNELAKIFLPLIDEFRIPLVISGHAHIFEAFYRKKSENNLETLFLVNGGGGGKLDDILLRRKSFITVPYRWEDREHVAKKKPFLGGNPNSPFRNDEALINYQEYGAITHSWCKIKIKNSGIHVETYDWEGNLLYQKDIPIIHNFSN